MAADVQQDDLPVGDHDGKSDAIDVGDAHLLDTLQCTGQVVKLQVGLKRIALQITQYGSNLGA